MTVEASSFNFSDVYRTLQPTALREVVAAREASHGEISKQIKFAVHVMDLCRLAFGMTTPAQSELGNLLLAEVRKGDVHFSLTHDRAEAGRIAALILASRLAQGCEADAIVVLATSFGGLRTSADEDGLAPLATACLTRGARTRGSTKAPNVAYPKSQDRSALVAALDQGVTPQSVKPLAEALITDHRTAGDGLATATTAAVQGLFSENQRLAEEIDLLWWHMGNWSECLGRPIDQVPDGGRALIAGADLAAITRTLPGPYGTVGILRRSLGADPDRPMTLNEAVETLTPDDLKQVYRQCTDTDVLPVHTAVQLYQERGRGEWGQAFQRACGVSSELPLSHYKIALQAFWECSLVQRGWAK